MTWGLAYEIAPFDTGGNGGYLEQYSEPIISRPRPLSRPHLKSDTAKTPDVDLVGVTGPTRRGVDDFGSHPMERPLHRGMDTGTFA